MDEGRVSGLWAPQRRALTAGLVLTITFVASEALAVVTVMPVVARDLGGLSLYGWVFSGVMLGSVVGIVAAGREADRRGPAVPFVAGVVMFGSGLAVAGLERATGVACPAVDTEAACRAVIGWVCLTLRDRPEQADMVSDRLERELQGYLERLGKVGLPPIR